MLVQQYRKRLIWHSQSACCLRRLSRRAQGNRGEKNRSFGLLLGAMCAILGVLAYRADRSSDTVWTVLAVILLAVALLAPRLLAPCWRFCMLPCSFRSVRS
jgi:hypothetical protein